MALRLHEDWSVILRRAWSMRFMGAAFMFEGGSVFLQMEQPYSHLSPVVMALGAWTCIVAAGVSRVIAQDSLRSGGNGPKP